MRTPSKLTLVVNLINQKTLNNDLKRFKIAYFLSRLKLNFLIVPK